MGLLTGLLWNFPTELGSKLYLVFCGYKSFKAIESEATEDDTQWLTFWMVLSLVQFAEFWADILRKWIPYYNEAKLGLVIWLGVFRGAQLLYDQGLRALLKQHEKKIDDVIGQAEEKARAAAKK